MRLTLPGIFFFGLALACSLGATAQQADEPAPETLMRDAYKAATVGVSRGTATGRYRVFEDAKQKEEAAIAVWFDKDKYAVELKYRDSKKPQEAKRIIICDGELVAYSKFWINQEHPTGAEGYLTEPDGVPYLRMPSTAHFPWDMSYLPKFSLATGTINGNASTTVGVTCPVFTAYSSAEKGGSTYFCGTCGVVECCCSDNRDVAQKEARSRRSLSACPENVLYSTRAPLFCHHL